MHWDLEEAIAYYKKQGAPADQGAIIALLKEIRQEEGGIPRYAVTRIAESYGVKEALLLAIIRRIPSLRLLEQHCLELCAGPNCGRHTALAAFAEKECRGKATVRFVPCMRMCAKGPNLKWDGRLYHRADEALIRELLASVETKPGQNAE